MLRLSLLALCVACSPVTAKVDYEDDTKRLLGSDAPDSPPDDEGDVSGSDSEDDAEDELPPADDVPPDTDDEEEPPVTDEDEDEDDDEDEDEDTDGLAEWTFMVYLAADNNLEEAGLKDLNEMEFAGSTDEVNIIVELDRAHGFTSADGDWKGARRYRAESDTDMSRINSPVLVDLGEVDSGDPATFIDFIEWSVENYPAKNYAFVIWNHGWSWTMAPTGARKGIASDDHSGSDLTVAGGEYESILEAAVDITGEPLALIGMDACLMASWEIARVSADYGDYYVASQATESFDGWAFDTALADLVADPEMSAAELGTVIAQRFHETDDATLSVTDLTQLAAMDGALDLFANAVIEDGNPRGEVRRQARDSQNFDGDPADRDLGDFMARMEDATDNPDILAAAQDVSAELSEVIVSNFTNGGWVSDATGMSIYLPVNGPDDIYLEGSWNDLTSWTEMLEAVDN